MAKPPKQISTSTPSSSRPSAQPPRVDVENLHALHQALHLQAGGTPADAPASSRPTDASSSRAASVELSDIPTNRIDVENSRRMIAWPQDQTSQLQSMGTDSGLFKSPDGEIYAYLGDEGHFLVRLNADADYQVPLPFTPDLAGPILKKIEGQPVWRIEPPAWLPRDTVNHPTAINLSTPARMKPVHPSLRNSLTQATESTDALRYDPQNRPYVDTREGTFMVHQRADGIYQQKRPDEATPSGYLLERIRGTNLWQKLQPSVTGTTTKRPSADDSAPVAGSSKHPRTEPQVLDLSNNQWRNWGLVNKPEVGQSVQIGELHYPIVSQIVRSNTPVVCIKHPQFNPERFEAFEQMLRADPGLQPRWAARGADDLWKTPDGRPPFTKPLSQYVADHVMYLSDHSANAVARAMFREPRGTEVINGEGLLALGQAFRHWEDRAIPVPKLSLADPLLLLPVQPSVNDGTRAGKIQLPALSTQNLQRLDFDPQKFAVQWREYAAAPGTSNLRKLFLFVLQNNGYTVSPPNHSLLENALIFHRSGVNALFVLKLPMVSPDFIQRYTQPGSELTSSAARMQLDGVSRQRLSALLAKNKIIYLIGGVQQTSADKSTLFMLREG